MVNFRSQNDEQQAEITPSNENPRFLDSAGTSEVIPNFFSPSSIETRYDNQSQKKDSYYEFLYSLGSLTAPESRSMAKA